MTEQGLLQGGTVFEITDHTTASDWERFIANLEEILSDWNLKQSKDKLYRELSPGAISSGLWHEKLELLKFGNVTFELRYQYLQEIESHSDLVDDNSIKHQKQLEDASSKSDLSDNSNSQNAEEDDAEVTKDDDFMSNTIPKEEEKEHDEYELPENLPECVLDLNATSNDFASKAHCLVRWYNLRRFIILSPRGDTIISEDRVKLVISSASVALSNIECHVPIFLQIHNPKNHFYQGISEHSNIRTMYEMVFYKKSLKQYGYLSELISMFREKASCNLNDPISATIRLNYCLSSFDLFVDPKDEFSGTEYADDDQDQQVKMNLNKRVSATKSNQTQDMRTGATFEQVASFIDECLPHPYRILKFLHIAALWPPVSDKVITDSQVHSDLDPAEAPVWIIRCVINDNCNMKIVHETQVVYELLKAAIEYAYSKLDAEVAFDDCDRETLTAKCLKLSYELATKPEVVLSDKPSDSLRKLIALLFHRAAELEAKYDALDQIASQVKKRPTLGEIYRNFSRFHEPSVKEFIIRTQISRPFNPISTPALPQRMFCTVSNEEFRLCGAFSELCN